jgi:POT family proton-dependent oligopeptide transporter
MDSGGEKQSVTPGSGPGSKFAVSDAAPAGAGPTTAGVGAPDVSLPAADMNRHPTGLWFFFWGEFAERSSYYGMRAILPLYLTAVLHFADTTAGPIYYGFKMACYFLPLVGGIIADRWLGRYWTIVGFSVPYVLGQFTLSIESQFVLFAALVLLAGGSGVIKPNISTLMGQTYDQQRPGQEQLRSAAFQWFYLSINIGALISMFVVPIMRNQWGYAIAFQFPAWLMVMALAVFAAGKRHYAVESVQRHELTPEDRRLQWQTLWRLFGIFALVVVFWVGYEHNDTIWVFFARDYVDLRVPGLGTEIKADQLQFLNSLFVIILIPTFNFLFPRLDPQMKIFTPMRKILAGFVFTAVSIAIMAVAGFLVEGHTAPAPEGVKAVEVATRKVSVWWPALAYIILTFGEVLLYGTMLELAYTAAPKSMKGFVTACFLVTNALSNLINMAWSPCYGGSLVDPTTKRGPLTPGLYFGITAAVTVAAAVGFLFIGRRFEQEQRDREAAEAARKALAAGDVGAARPGPSGDGITDRDRVQ